MTHYEPTVYRAAATLSLLDFFADIEHLPPYLQAISAPCRDLAFDIATSLPDNPELTAGLRKLLEAKDAFVRAALVAQSAAQTAAARDRITAGTVLNKGQTNDDHR